MLDFAQVGEKMTNNWGFKFCMGLIAISKNQRKQQNLVTSYPSKLMIRKNFLLLFVALYIYHIMIEISERIFYILPSEYRETLYSFRNFGNWKKPIKSKNSEKITRYVYSPFVWRLITARAPFACLAGCYQPQRC